MEPSEEEEAIGFDFEDELDSEHETEAPDNLENEDHSIDESDNIAILNNQEARGGTE